MQSYVVGIDIPGYVNDLGALSANQIATFRTQ